MKYIRTKDKVYSTSELIKCEDKRFTNEWFTKNVVPLIAINQADTIEELCDEFVLIDFTEKKKFYIHTNSFEEIKRFKDFLKEYSKKQKYVYEIYGAIWTDKGLIYVAKMNEKGELELI